MAEKKLMIGIHGWRQGSLGDVPPELEGKVTSMLAHAKNWLDLKPTWTEDEPPEGGEAIDWYYLADILDAIITKIHSME
jgi:hypothetical protein